MTILWDQAFETGIRSTDLQHQELVSLINQLDAMHADGLDAEALNEALPRLTTYVLFHFSAEESLLNRLIGQSDFQQQHLVQHREFVARVDAIKSGRAAQADGQVVIDLLDYLGRWLLHHIATADRELGRLLLAQGAAYAYA